MQPYNYNIIYLTVKSFGFKGSFLHSSKFDPIASPANVSTYKVDQTRLTSPSLKTYNLKIISQFPVAPSSHHCSANQ